jgi:hypothetical protein
VLVAPDFVFLHIPKTGGSFVQGTVLDRLPGVWHASYTHTPFGELTESASALPGFYVVRNPWDWYVSWYLYTLQRGTESRRLASGPPRKRVIWRDLMDSGSATFAEAVQAACRGAYDSASVFPNSDVTGLDLYSAFVQTIVGDALDRSDYTAVRFERLRREVTEFLRDREGVDKPLLKAIRNAPAVRKSDRGRYQDYYDVKTRKLVRRSTAWLCERFGYRFEKPGQLRATPFEA